MNDDNNDELYFNISDNPENYTIYYNNDQNKTISTPSRYLNTGGYTYPSDWGYIN